MSIEFLAVLASASGAAYASSKLWRAWILNRHLRHQWESKNSDYLLQSQHELEHQLHALQIRVDRQARPVSTWRDVQVAQIVNESPSCKSLYLVDPTLERLPHFQSGQHIIIEATLPGHEKPTRRCYSLSSSPSNGFWRITLRRSRRESDTSMSQFLHDCVQVGDLLHVKGPQGNFTYSSIESKQCVMLAAGIGITPILSMIYEWSERNDASPLQVHYQVHSALDVPLLDELRQLEESRDHLRVKLWVTEMNQGELQPGFENSAVQPRDIVLGPDHQNAVYVICGPGGWMAELVTALTSLGISHDSIHFESFGGFDSQLPRMTDKKKSEPTLAKVTLHKSAQTISCREDCENLLDLAKSRGAAIDSGCRAGNCGACLAKLLSGDVTYRIRPQCEHAEDEVVMCVAQPAGDLVLDL